MHRRMLNRDRRHREFALKGWPLVEEEKFCASYRTIRRAEDTECAQKEDVDIPTDDSTTSGDVSPQDTDRDVPLVDCLANWLELREMAPTICCRDVSHKLHRRQQKQLPIAAAAENEDEVMTTGSGGGMSLAASGRTRMVAKNQRTPKNAAIRRRRRRGVAWLLHEIEDSRISTTTTTTANSESTMVKKNRNQRQVENSSEEEYEGSDTEAELDSRFGRLAATPEGHKRPGGLLGITMRTVELIRRNQLLQWRLAMLQEETRAFVKSVMSNPENQRVEREAKTNASDGAQDPAVSGSC